MLAGSKESDIAGTGRKPAGGATQSIAQSFASVADPPFPKRINLPPRLTRSPMASAAFAMRSASSLRDLCPQLRVFLHLHLYRLRDLVQKSIRVLLLAAQKRIQKCRHPHIVAEFPMLEEDMHRFPERVIENLDQLLVDERSLVVGV